MNILVDEDVLFAEEVFSQIGLVRLKKGREITSYDLIDVDALVIRSVTKVNASLLERANRLKFLGTATSGTDHVDQILLKEKGISFTAAPGCNSVGVAEYVLSLLVALGQQQGFSVFDKRFGIIGAGQVGSHLHECLTGVGIKVFLNDPLKELDGDKRAFTPLEFLLAHSDVITIHTPLTNNGPWATRHMFDQERLNALTAKQILVNTARGPIIDNEALKKRLKAQDGFTAALDVFEQEPPVDSELLSLLTFATPHIAGHCLDSKCRGTAMVFNALCQFLGKKLPLDPTKLLPVAPILKVSLSRKWDQSDLNTLIQIAFDIRKDDAVFRHRFSSKGAFDQIRREYRNRREFGVITVQGRREFDLCSLKKLGFKTEF